MESTTLAMTEIETAWEAVVLEFRKVCLLKKEGRGAEAEQILATRLPGKIAEWSKLSPLDAATKKQQLQGMLIMEQRRSDESVRPEVISKAELSASSIEEIKKQLTAELRQQFLEWIGQAQGAATRVPTPVVSSKPLPWKSENAQPVAQPSEIMKPRPEIEDIATALDRVLLSQAERLQFTPQKTQQL